MRFHAVTAVILSLAAFSPAAYAQVSINGSLRGHISDPGAASVAGASVKLNNVATTTTQTMMSDGDGDYHFARIAPGVYSLTVEKEGFKRAQRDNIVIAVNENAVADVTLAVGAMNETLTVEAGAALTQSQSVELSGLVSERRDNIQIQPGRQRDQQHQRERALKEDVGQREPIVLIENSHGQRQRRVMPDDLDPPGVIAPFVMT